MSVLITCVPRVLAHSGGPVDLPGKSGRQHQAGGTFSAGHWSMGRSSPGRGGGVGCEWKSPLCTWTLYVKAGGQEAMCLNGVSCSACPNCEEHGQNVGQGQDPDWLM